MSGLGGPEGASGSGYRVTGSSAKPNGSDLSNQRPAMPPAERGAAVAARLQELRHFNVILRRETATVLGGSFLRHMDLLQALDDVAHESLRYEGLNCLSSFFNAVWDRHRVSNQEIVKMPRLTRLFASTLLLQGAIRCEKWPDAGGVGRHFCRQVVGAVLDCFGGMCGVRFLGGFGVVESALRQKSKILPLEVRCALWGALSSAAAVEASAPEKMKDRESNLELRNRALECAVVAACKWANTVCINRMSDLLAVNRENRELVPDPLSSVLELIQHRISEILPPINKPRMTEEQEGSLRALATLLTDSIPYHLVRLDVMSALARERWVCAVSVCADAMSREDSREGMRLWRRCVEGCDLLGDKYALDTVERLAAWAMTAHVGCLNSSRIDDPEWKNHLKFCIHRLSNKWSGLSDEKRSNLKHNNPTVRDVIRWYGVG
jgi:hypothetical protein